MMNENLRNGLITACIVALAFWFFSDKPEPEPLPLGEPYVPVYAAPAHDYSAEIRANNRTMQDICIQTGAACDAAAVTQGQVDRLGQ